MKKPIFSPGRFSSKDPVDLSCRNPSSNLQNCATTSVDQETDSIYPNDSGQRSSRRRDDQTPGDPRDFATTSVEQTSNTDSSNSGQKLGRRRAGRPTPTKKEPPEKVDEWWMVD